MKYQLDLGQAANLLLVGQNVPYSHRMGAYDLATGAPKFPAVVTDDYQFLSSSTVANVAGGASNQILAGTGLGLLHAYDGVTGQDAPGFPKTTGGWLFSPAAVSDDKRLGAITREGYLFEWKAPDTPGCQKEWPAFRHDQQGTGNYDDDGTPPAAPGTASLKALGGNRYRLSFRSPGDDGFCGTANRYVAKVNGLSIDLGAPVGGGAAFAKDITLPAASLRLTVQAADGPAAGPSNLGPPAVFARSAPGAGFKPSSPPAKGPSNPKRRSCLPRRVSVSAGRIGPARLGRSLKALERRYRVTRRSRRGVRFCVTGGGRFLVSARKGKIALVATTARRHRTRRRGPGTRVRHGRVRGTRRIGHGVLLGHITRAGRVVYGVRRGKIRYLAVASRSQGAHRRTLVRTLRRLGL